MWSMLLIQKADFAGKEHTVDFLQFFYRKEELAKFFLYSRGVRKAMIFLKNTFTLLYLCNFGVEIHSLDSRLDQD